MSEIYYGKLNENTISIKMVKKKNWPDSATSATETFCLNAINPKTENITNPAKRLVKLFATAKSIASLKK